MSGPSSATRFFTPSTHSWSGAFGTKSGAYRQYGTTVLLPLNPPSYTAKVMIMGGYASGGSAATSTTEILDLGAATPVWDWGPDMSQGRTEMNAVILPNGQVLATGGSVLDETASTASLNADIYDPEQKSFLSGGANAFPRLYHSVALLLPDATVWLAGSNPTRGSYETHMELYKPAYLFNTDGSLAVRPTISSAPAVVSFGSSFTVQTPDPAGISSVALVRLGSPTHAFDQDQRLVGLSFTSGSSQLTVTAPPNGNVAPPGYYMLFILNNFGVPSIAKFIQVTAANDFTISASPASRSVVQGSGTTFGVTVGAVGAFSGTVGLSVSGLPSGATAGFNPTSVNTSGSSTLSVSTLPSTPQGTYPLTITGTSGSRQHTTSVSLTVTEPADFSFSVTPSSRILPRNSSVTFSISVSKLGSFAGSVSLGVTGLPRQTKATFTPSSINVAGSSTLTLTAQKMAPQGTYQLTVRGTSGSIVHSQVVTLTIQ
jgi:hypothetical protein